MQLMRSAALACFANMVDKPIGEGLDSFSDIPDDLWRPWIVKRINECPAVRWRVVDLWPADSTRHFAPFRVTLPGVRFLAVSGFFVAINLVAAGTYWVLGRITLLVIPDASERLLPFVFVGVFALAAAMLAAKWGLALLSRLTS